jgi:Protein of unknown function (DUF3253)
LSDDIEQLLREKILALLAARKPGSSICPSDAPRALFTDWRNHMPTVRQVALQMAHEGLVEITQKHLPVNLEQFGRGEVTGPIRLRLVGMAIG